MDDEVFLARLQDKLERITNRDVELRVVDDDPTFLEVDLEGVDSAGGSRPERVRLPRLRPHVPGVRRGVNQRRPAHRRVGVSHAAGPQLMSSPPPQPPDALKPWYYQGWFIVPTFVWWPCSAILFIRSPWHNGVVSGALSWAWIIVGGGWIFLRTQLRLQNGEPLLDPTLLALAAPGHLPDHRHASAVADPRPTTHPAHPRRRRVCRLR